MGLPQLRHVPVSGTEPAPFQSQPLTADQREQFVLADCVRFVGGEDGAFGLIGFGKVACVVHGVLLTVCLRLDNP